MSDIPTPFFASSAFSTESLPSPPESVVPKSATGADPLASAPLGGSNSGEHVTFDSSKPHAHTHFPARSQTLPQLSLTNHPSDEKGTSKFNATSTQISITLSPTILPAPPQGPVQVKDKEKGKKKAKSAGKEKKRPQWTRYIPPNKNEAFIGPVLPTTQETIALIRTQCPSLATVTPDAISLRIRFDANVAAACENVLFRVLDDAWPVALHDEVHLIHVVVSSGAAETSPSTYHGSNGSLAKPDAALTNHKDVREAHPDSKHADAEAATSPCHPTDGQKPRAAWIPASWNDDSLLTWDDMKRQGALLGIEGAHSGPADGGEAPSLSHKEGDSGQTNDPERVQSWDELKDLEVDLGVKGHTDVPQASAATTPMDVDPDARRKNGNSSTDTWDDLVRQGASLGIDAPVKPKNE